MPETKDKDVPTLVVAVGGKLPDCPHCRAKVLEALLERIALQQGVGSMDMMLTSLAAIAHLLMRHLVVHPGHDPAEVLAEAWGDMCAQGFGFASEWFPEDLPGGEPAAGQEEPQPAHTHLH